MSRENLNRVLELVCRELGSVDARLEIGGRPPEGPGIIYADIPAGWRLVALFDEPPEAPHELAVRLRHMAASFFDIGMPAPSARPDAERHLARRRLEDELCALAGRTQAASAVVIDVKSPVIWGSSEPRGEDYDLNEALAFARLAATAREHHADLAMVAGLRREEMVHELAQLGLSGEEQRRAERLLERLAGRPLRARRAQFIEARVLAEIRAEAENAEGGPPSFRRLVRTDGIGYFARSFASIYVLVLCFEGDFSELHVEGASLHALPVIERHVLALPPVEPPPRGGRVVRLPRR